MKHIVTDMGGVIIDLYWIESIQKVIGKTYDLDELIQIWHKCKLKFFINTLSMVRFSRVCAG